MNEKNNYGAFIESGASDWQVFQQVGGFADISLEGSWKAEDKTDGYQVYLRVFSENSNHRITDVIKAEMLPDNKWKAALKNIPAGGPYRIQTCLQESEAGWALMWTTRGNMRHHICVGDVYLIMGQSNAVGYAKDVIEDAPEIGVHMFRECGRWDLASHPLHDSTDTIFPSFEDGANTGHSPYLSFAKKMKRKNGRPVGLIMIAKGGSIIDLFNPENESSYWQAMKEMAAAAGVTAPRAIFWHQGCTDAAEKREGYKEKLIHLIETSREYFKSENLPWYIYQIGRFPPREPLENTFWGKVKQAQFEISREIHDTYIISTTDCITSDDVHNNSYSNVMLGERLAGYVLRSLEGDTTQYFCPEFSSAKICSDKHTVEIKFKNVIESISKVHNVDVPFTLENAEGKEIKITSWESNLDSAFLHTEEEIEKGAMVSMCWQACFTFKPPFDSGNRLPVVAFYREECK